MTDYSNIIGKIKESDVRISTLTKEIKEMENTLKNVAKEIEITKGKNKELIKDISYKTKIIKDKENETSILQKQNEVLYEMKIEKKRKEEDAEKKLEAIQKEVLQTRLEFNEATNQFLSECDFLSTRSNDVEELCKKKEEENSLLKDISNIDNNIKILEAEQKEYLKELEALQILEKTKQNLEGELDQGEEFKRIRMKIELCEEELDDFVPMSNFRRVTKTQSFTTSVQRDGPSSVDDGENVQLKADIFPKNNSYGSETYNITISSGLLIDGMPGNEHNIFDSKERKSRNFTPKFRSNLTKTSSTQRAYKQKKLNE